MAYLKDRIWSYQTWIQILTKQFISINRDGTLPCLQNGLNEGDENCKAYIHYCS